MTNEIIECELLTVRLCKRDWMGCPSYEVLNTHNKLRLGFLRKQSYWAHYAFDPVEANFLWSRGRMRRLADVIDQIKEKSA